MHHEVVNELARKYKKSNLQILMRWGLQHDIVINPGERYVAEYVSMFDFALAPGDIERLNEVHQKSPLY